MKVEVDLKDRYEEIKNVVTTEIDDMFYIVRTITQEWRFPLHRIVMIKEDSLETENERV